MNREVSLGVVGLVFGYLGVRSICQWLVDRTFSDKPENDVHVVGNFTKDVSIFGCENNYSKWNKLIKPTSCETFELVPVSYRIAEWTGPRIDLQTTNGPFTCILEPNVDVQLNTCVLTQGSSHVNTDYNGILNYPTQLEIRLRQSTKIVVYGRLEGATFRISKLSNYPVVQYKSIMVSQKMQNIGMFLGVTAVLAILFRQFKE